MDMELDVDMDIDMDVDMLGCVPRRSWRIPEARLIPCGDNNIGTWTWTWTCLHARALRAHADERSTTPHPTPPLQVAAIRELREETGYVGRLAYCSGRLAMSPGLCDETIKLVVVEVCP